MAIHNSMVELCCCYAAPIAMGIASKSPDLHRVFQHPRLKSTIEGTCLTSRLQSTHRCLTFPNPFCEKRSLGVSEKFCVVFRREFDDLFQELDLLFFIEEWRRARAGFNRNSNLQEELLLSGWGADTEHSHWLG